MNLLIVTQKADKNDPILGFFHRWIEEFSKQFENVILVCLYKGECDFPANVKVLSLGKENGESRFKYIANFYRYICSERKNYDKVFVHMNQIYVVLGALLWKSLGKKITLWYTHRMVGVTLRIATALSDVVFTASKESFRLESRKVMVMGHGIDTDIFSPLSDQQAHDPYTILSVGRVSSTKNQLVMAEAFAILKQKGFKGKLVFVGSPVTEADEEYLKSIKVYVEKNALEDEIIFEGSSKPHLVIDAYRDADLFINLSATGSLDKAVLEAMASGLQVVTSNEAFKNIVPGKNQCSLSPSEIAEKILSLSKEEADPSLRQYVVEKNNINNLIPAICTNIKE